jgi:hypothetical protein
VRLGPIEFFFFCHIFFLLLPLSFMALVIPKLKSASQFIF